MGWGEPHAEPLHGRALLDALGPLLEPVRRLRYENRTSFDDVTVEELERAERALKALSYSCAEGARFLERIRSSRGGHVNPVPVGIDEDVAADVIEVRDGDRVLARIVDVGECK